MTVDALTVELGELVAAATELPTSIDPVRPPSVPGCFVGPPSLTPDTETGGRLLVAQWEVGTVTGADTGAWEAAAAAGEHIAAAVIGHPTLGLVDARSVLYDGGPGGELPGYRVDVAVLIHATGLSPLTPPVPPILGAATLAAPAAMTAAGTVLAVPVVDGAATLAAPAAMTAAGTVVPAAWSPAALPGLVGWWDADLPGSLTASAGKVSSWAPRAGTAPPMIQGTASLQPVTGAATLNGKNVVTFDNVDDEIRSAVTLAAPWTVLVVFRATAVNNWKYIFHGAGGDSTVYTVGGTDGYVKAAGDSSRVWSANIGQRTSLVYSVPASGQSAFYQNGVANPPVATGGNAGLAWAQVGGAGPLAGDVASVVVMVGQITPSDLAAYEAWVLSEWGPV